MRKTRITFTQEELTKQDNIRTLLWSLCNNDLRPFIEIAEEMDISWATLHRFLRQNCPVDRIRLKKIQNFIESKEVVHKII